METVFRKIGIGLGILCKFRPRGRAPLPFIAGIVVMRLQKIVAAVLHDLPHERFVRDSAPLAEDQAESAVHFKDVHIHGIVDRICFIRFLVPCLTQGDPRSTVSHVRVQKSRLKGVILCRIDFSVGCPHRQRPEICRAVLQGFTGIENVRRVRRGYLVRIPHRLLTVFLGDDDAVIRLPLPRCLRGKTPAETRRFVDRQGGCQVVDRQSVDLQICALSQNRPHPTCCK